MKFLEIDFNFSAYGLESKIYLKLVNFNLSRKT